MEFSNARTPGKNELAGGATLPSSTTRRNRRRARWEALSIAVLLLAVSVAATVGLWTVSSSHDDAAFQRYVTTLAEVAAARVDPDVHALLLHPEQTNGADYQRAIKPLHNLQRSVPAIHYIYTLIWDGTDLRYVLDSGDPNRKVNDVADQARIGQRFGLAPDVDPSPLLAVFGIGSARPRTFVTPIVSDQWGSFVVAFAPIIDDHQRPIACAGVAVDASVYLAQLRSLRASASLGLIPAGLLIILLGFSFYFVRLRSLTLEAILVDAAHRDKLTGLANRRVFMERLDAVLEAVRRQERPRAAVLFADFDRFKLVNDTMGHDAGDELLRQIAARLTQFASCNSAPKVDGEVLVSRFGGDEFLLLCTGSAAEDVGALSEALMKLLGRSYDVLGGPVQSTASIGWVTNEDGALSADELVRHADIAMYEAKNRGRGCCIEFDAGMRARLARSRALEAGLREAIGTDQLHVEYQPVVDLRSGRTVCVEALLRWQHPILGLVPPAELLPVAEEAGLAGTLGNWLLKECCRALAGWRSTDPQRAPQRVSVNLGRAQLAQDRSLPEVISAALSEAQLPAECLQLEISESDMVQDAANARVLLHRLRDLGVRLTLDNFGSTTSALALLRDNPFDTVKIDRTLVARFDADEESNRVIRAALQLVENLGMVSVAQGVESLTQLAVLETLGCSCAQGHFIGMPLPTGRVLAVENLKASRLRAPEEADVAPISLWRA